MNRGLLLDVDGTLVDSNDLHARAFVEAFAASGREVSFERVRRLVGKGGDKLIPEAAGADVSEEEQERIGEGKSKVFLRRHLPAVQPFRGVKELVAGASALGLRVAVASSAGEEELDALLEIAGVREALHATTSSDDADRSKPDPDIVVAACRKIRLAPRDVFLLGDTPYDIEAARRAGVTPLAVRCGGLWDDEALRGAEAIFDGPWDPALLSFLQRTAASSPE